MADTQGRLQFKLEICLLFHFARFYSSTFFWFIQDYQNFEGNVFCILDAGAAADKATNDICTYFGKNAVDLRPELNIGTHHESFDDLNDLLVDKINLMKKKNISQNEIDNYNRVRGNLRR